MPRAIPFREAASVHVRATPQRVLALVSDPAVLQALDDRIPLEGPVEVAVDGPRVEVRGRDDHVHLSFSMTSEGDGTRLAATESVRPTNPIEATKHALFPRRAHDEFRDELGRLKALIEALEDRTASV